VPAPPRRTPLALVLNNFDPGGTERQMTELLTRLDKTVFDVHVACLRRSGALLSQVEASAASVEEFPVRGFLTAGAVQQAARFTRWCRSLRLQVVHACDFYANVFALMPAACARVPTRLGSRRELYIPGRTAAHQRLERLAYRAAHKVVCNSQAAMVRLNQEGVSRQKLELISNGIDPGRFRTGHPARTPRSIMTVAHLRPGKGIDVLLDAAAIVMRSVPDVTFQIVGDGSLRGELEAHCRALGVGGRVHFLGHTNDVAARLADASIFAFPSLMEALPNSVLEAMSAGLPVVASAVGGIPEVIDNERNGLLVPPQDPAALAAALERLLRDQVFAQRLGTAARATIESRFSFERMVSRFAELYRGTASASEAGLARTQQSESSATGHVTREIAEESLGSNLAQ
jgi:glycosyltransferase involved in cell wall biosynthesis